MSFFSRPLNSALLLAIDVGNTNVVFALYNGKQQISQYRLHTQANYTGDDIAVWLQQLLNLEQLNFKQIKHVIIASVVPALDFALQQFCQRHLQLEPVMVTAASQLGLELRQLRPEQIGADRIANAVAVKQYYALPAVVIDFGTATTFDVLDAAGNHIGGAIAPGPQQSLTALVQAAAKLPQVTFAKPPQVLGQDTVSAMQSGLFWGYVGLIEGLLNRLQTEQGQFASIIATGGLAALFADAIPAIQTVDGDLTLKGLLVLWHLNKA